MNGQKQTNVYEAIATANAGGICRLFLKLYEGKIVYTAGEKCFWYFKGPTWVKDETEKHRFITLLMKRHISDQIRWLVYDLQNYIADLRFDTNSKPLQEKVKMLVNFEQKSSYFQYCQDLTYFIDFDSGNFDKIPGYLPVGDKLINMETGEARPILPSDYITQVAQGEWKDIDEECPRWDKFILEIMGNNPEKAKFLQRVLGYSLTGCRREHKIIFFVGPGRNGKDTLFIVLHSIFGHLVSEIPGTIFFSKFGEESVNGDAREDLMSLRGVRIGYHGESNKNNRLDAAQGKALSGNKIVTARPLYGKYVTFESYFTPYLLTNFPPAADSTDDALWKRMLLVLFDQIFKDPESEGMPQAPNEHIMDKTLEEKLVKEANGIISWLVRGAMDYYKLGSLAEPENVKQDTKNYRRDEDALEDFIEEYCEKDADFKVQVTPLYNAY